MNRMYRCEELEALPAGWGRSIRRPAGAATFADDRFAYWDALASAAFPEETGIGWFELHRRPLQGSEVERHLGTPEALLCFEGEAACVLGAPVEPADLGPDRVRAFRVRRGEGILMWPRTWHALPFPLTERAVFWVVFRKGTAHDDLHVIDLERAGGFGFLVTPPAGP